MLGVIENIICWLDHASVNLLSLGLIWFWFDSLLLKDFIYLWKWTCILAVSREELLFPGSFKVDRICSSPNICSSSSPSGHLLQLIEFLTSLLRSNLQIDLLAIVSVKILRSDLIILPIFCKSLCHLVVDFIFFTLLIYGADDAQIIISAEVNLARLHFLHVIADQSLVHQFLAEPRRTDTACLGILVANDEEHLFLAGCIT